MGENKNLPEKVLLMYRAVWDMIGEGCDINTMKVSDITTRAGIGKGTAYEYFSSKEEIITKALVYDVDEKLRAVTEIVESSRSFAEKIEAILDFIEEKFCESQTFCALVRMGTGSYEVSAPLRSECERMQQNLEHGRIEAVETLIEKIMRCGQEEGVIGQKNPYFNQMAFSAQMLGFAGYLVSFARGTEEKVTAAEAKKFVYESLVKSLN